MKQHPVHPRIKNGDRAYLRQTQPQRDGLLVPVDQQERDDVDREDPDAVDWVPLALQGPTS